jgi:TM2 domain-containing membrane protein YozV
MSDAINGAVGKLRAETVNKSGYLEDRKLYFAAMEKSEPLAGLLSAVVGFGAGSFYAGDNGMGIAFMAGEGGIIALSVLGSGTGSSPIQGALYVALALARIGDVVVGILDTTSANEELTRRMQIGQIKLGQSSPSSQPANPTVTLPLLSWKF